MKRKMIFSVLVVACISLSACGNNSAEKTSSEVIIEETSEVITNEAGEVYEENSDRLDIINEEDFKKKISSQENFWIYVGRPNCPDCQKYYPRLEKYLEDNDLKLLYFNTKVKVSQKEEMVEFLNDLGVDEVPAILEIKNGKVEKIYDMQKEEDIVNFEVEYK